MRQSLLRVNLLKFKVRSIAYELLLIRIQATATVF